MITYAGRVVYDRKTHFFTRKDVIRIQKNYFYDWTIENPFEAMMESLGDKISTPGEFGQLFTLAIKAFEAFITIGALK